MTAPGLARIADRFTLERLVGAGGMGSIYRAVDAATGEPAAVKLLHVTDGDVRDHFLVEAKVLATLSHPGIVRYLAHGTTESGDLYLAMEWLDGEDLAHRLERGRLSVDESLALVERVALALAAAHERGVVHRDLSPTNVFLPGGDLAAAKLIDFGVARDAGTPETTRTGTIVGTPAYMSPEQARGEATLDARADVFALGLLLYECLTGKRAFTADSVMGTLAKILFEDTPLVRDLLPDVPAGVETLLARMLAKERGPRPHDGAAAAAAVGAVRATQAADAVPVPSPVSLTGREQRLLCVICAQYRLPRLGPDRVDETLPAAGTDTRGAMQRLVELVHITEEYGARLEPLANGTFVVAFEGAGVATDQAARSARCALKMRAILPEAPMVLATGRAFFGRRWPIGEVIDRAAKLLGDVPRRDGPRPVRLDQVTAALLDQRFDVRMVGDALQLYQERQGEGARRTLLGKLTPCVGRERELGIISGAFAECTSEPVARVFLVTGPAGIGKSRLRQEIVRLSEPQAPVVLFGRGDVVGEGAPFSLAGQALRGAAGIHDGEAASARQGKLRRHVARHVPAAEVERVTTFLAEIAGAPFPPAHSMELAAARKDAMLMGDQIRRAWDDWLAAETAHGAVLLVLENLQWGDLPSLRLVELAVRNLHDRPLFVLALARPEVRERFPQLWSDIGFQGLSLGPLSRKSSEKLVRLALGDGAAPELTQRLVERAAGNAFFLEELIRCTAEGRDTNPDSVVAMVAARIEALEPEARRVLRAASVFGAIFWDGAVRALLGDALSVEDTAAWLQRLSERELVAPRAESAFPGLREYVFRQDLVREAAYAMLTDADRTLGHRLAGRFLEDAGETNAVVLAEHFERGGEPARAVSWYRRAAMQALEGNDFAATLASAARGVACGAAGETLAFVATTQAEAHRWRGEFPDAERAARTALDAAPAGSPLWCAAAAELARACKAEGKGEELDALAEVLGQRSTDDPEAAVAVITVAGSLVQMGHYELARRLLARVTEGRSAAEPRVSAWLHAVRGIDAKSHGDPAGYLHCMETAAAAFRQLGDLRRAHLYEANVGYATLELGDTARAEPALRAALAGARRLGLVSIAAIAAQNLGIVLALRGATVEGIACEEDAAASFARQGDRRLESLARSYLAQILVGSGDLARAQREAEAALELGAAVLPCRAFALGQLARVRLAASDARAALAAAEEGMAILASLGSLEEGESLLRLAHAEALAAVGRVAESRAALATARERLLAQAGRISDPVLKDSFLAGVPEHARTIALAGR